MCAEGYPAVETVNLSCLSPLGSSASPILKGIDLRVHPGERWGVLGASGSGKSTLLRALVGLEPRSVGKVLLEGQSLEESSPKVRQALRRRAPLLLQDPGHCLDPRQRVLDAVTEPLRAAGESRARSRERAVEWLRRLELPERRWQAFPSELSGGERQRVALARSLVLKPSLLLADEPASALDPALRFELADFLRKWVETSGSALLWADHDLALARAVSDRILVLLAGRIVEQGPTDQVLSRPSHPWTQAAVSVWLDSERKRKLDQGVPFDKVSRGCAWAASCAEARAPCWESEPALLEIGPTGHRVACFARQSARHSCRPEAASTGSV